MSNKKRDTAICGLNRKAREHQPITHKNANVKKKNTAKKGQLNTKKNLHSLTTLSGLESPPPSPPFPSVLRCSDPSEVRDWRTDVPCSVLQCWKKYFVQSEANDEDCEYLNEGWIVCLFQNFRMITVSTVKSFSKRGFMFKRSLFSLITKVKQWKYQIWT